MRSDIPLFLTVIHRILVFLKTVYETAGKRTRGAAGKLSLNNLE